YYICQFKDNLPHYGWEYVWNENSPLNSNGEWENSKDENKIILKSIFTSPKYLFLFSVKSVGDTFKQFFSYKVGDGLLPNTENSNTYWQVHNLFNIEFIDFTKSLQYKGELKTE